MGSLGRVHGQKTHPVAKLSAINPPEVEIKAGSDRSLSTWATGRYASRRWSRHIPATSTASPAGCAATAAEPKTSCRKPSCAPGARSTACVKKKAAKGWLFIILRREHARGHDRYTPPHEDIDPDEFADDAVTSIEVLHLRHALAQLPEDYREPLLLQVLGGFSGEEIAAIMRILPATVMTRLFRARQRMRAALSVPETTLRAHKVKP